MRENVTSTAAEVNTSVSTKATTHPPLFFSSSEINLRNQKHLGLILNSKLSFNEYINDKIYKRQLKVSVSFKNQKYQLINYL